MLPLALPLALPAAVTAVTAAAFASTRYERTLRSCRALSDFAGCSEPGAVWDDARFREWAREHRAEATKQAGRFVARLLRDKAANQSVGYTARLHVTAWKAYGVTVEQSVLDDLSRLRPLNAGKASGLRFRVVRGAGAGLRGGQSQIRQGPGAARQGRRRACG